VTSPWLPVEPLTDDAFAHVRRRAIFDCCKWDPQVGDSSAIAKHPLVLTSDAWRDVVRLAEALAHETRAAEEEIVHRTDLHRQLGLPRAIRGALRRAHAMGASTGTARLIRFDFHFTEDGWRISEANCDVPGGLNEASGFPTLVAPHYPWAAPVGDPVASYVDALAARVGDRGTIALVHATSYSDDQQMMTFVGRRLAARGIAVHLASPSHLRWRDGTASLDAEWWRGPIDLVVRFFPAEWLDGLPRATEWRHLFAGARTPISNPATAIVAQSKRFPLIWGALDTPLPTWRALLPETRDARDAPWQTSNEWILKPALGRVGEGVGMRDLIESREMQTIARNARRWPRAWIAQRRFRIVPADAGSAQVFPCLGVYTLDARVIGAYGRLARRPLIDSRAADAAVLAI
jgi:glutathionylspermidine synthase